MLRMTAVLSCCGLMFSAALAGEPPKPNPETVVLDMGRGSFRFFVGWKTPTLIAADGKLKPLLQPKQTGLKEEDRKPMPMRQSDRPASNPSATGSGPIGWTAPEFDDSAWPRVRDSVAGLNTWNVGSRSGEGHATSVLEGDLVCVRGAFTVTDPAQVREPKLFLRYQGGAVVYVNGAELARGHLPEGQLVPDALAARYADDAYVGPDGKIRRSMSEDPKGIAELLTVRGRELKPGAFANGIAIPAAMLRKGVNVVAIEVRCAPVHEYLLEGAPEGWKGGRDERFGWLHAAVVDARVTSESGAGLAPSGVGAQGIEIGTTQPIETDQPGDFAHPSEKVVPIRLAGARNGTFSGKVVLSSAGAIRNLRASASELVQVGGSTGSPPEALSPSKGGGGQIPASAIQLRLAERARPESSWSPGDRFDRLLGEFPPEIAPVSVDRKRPALAVAPVWVTVRVPKDAPAGEYQGTVTIEADGSAHAKFSVPVRLKVNGWSVPDPKDFVTHNDIYQSVDAVARHYKVPLWSDKHFELMGKSLKAFQEVGNKICLVHLVVKSPGLNNTESMVRWVKKPGGGYDYDFSIADRYMDLYEKNCGKPAILAVDIEQTREGGQGPNSAAQNPQLGVSVLDPATGKVEAVPQPPYGTPESEAFWRPVLTELRARLEKRGWFDVTALQHVDYARPPWKEVVSTMKRIWPDGKWLVCNHPLVKQFAAKEEGSSMPVPYVEFVWGAGSLYMPDYRGERMYNPQPNGYPRAWTDGANRIVMGDPRYGVGFLVDALRPGSSLAEHRFVIEGAMQGGLRGIGRVGGDDWPQPSGKDGRFMKLFDEYGAVSPGESTVALFSPGPDGAAFNTRTEMLREGVQVCEAIIFLQRAVVNKQVGDDLARKIDELLVERARYYLRAQHPNRTATRWYAMECSNWQGRDDRLFALCAEVARTK